jgi:opacity protein-like surface antigen
MKKSPAFVLAGLLVLVAALPAAAQEGHWLGVKAGYGWPSPSVSTALPTTSDFENDGGLVVGLSWEGGIRGNWTLESEFLYVRRTTTVDFFGGTSSQGQPQGDITTEYTFTTIEIPFHAKYAFSAGATTPYVLGGFSTAIPIEIEAVNTSNGLTGKEKVKDQFDKAWFALELGAGVEHKLGGGVGLQLDVRYVYGLTNTAAIQGDSWKWRDVRVLAGVKFSL